MNLHDHLAHTLDQLEDDQPGPDLARLARTARGRGTRLRRRRTTGLAVAASVAALALTGVALTATGSGDSPVVAADTGPAASAESTVVQPDLTGPTAPTTAPGAALALQWAVDQQRAGSASDLAGQLSATSGDHFVELRWDDADGLGGSEVGVNVQAFGGMGTRCPQPVSSCTDTVAPDGSRMITYEERTVEADGTAVRRTVDLRRADGMRVSVFTTNGFEEGGDRWDLTRAEPPLTQADLEAIVRQPFWGPTLPLAWVGAKTPAGYVDLDADRGDWTTGVAPDAG